MTGKCTDSLWVVSVSRHSCLWDVFLLGCLSVNCPVGGAVFMLFTAQFFLFPSGTITLRLLRIYKTVFSCSDGLRGDSFTSLCPVKTQPDYRYTHLQAHHSDTYLFFTFYLHCLTGCFVAVGWSSSSCHFPSKNTKNVIFPGFQMWGFPWSYIKVN